MHPGWLNRGLSSLLGVSSPREPCGPRLCLHQEAHIGPGGLLGHRGTMTSLDACPQDAWHVLSRRGPGRVRWTTYTEGGVPGVLLGHPGSATGCLRTRGSLRLQGPQGCGREAQRHLCWGKPGGRLRNRDPRPAVRLSCRPRWGQAGKAGGGAEPGAGPVAQRQKCSKAQG